MIIRVNVMNYGEYCTSLLLSLQPSPLFLVFSLWQDFLRRLCLLRLRLLFVGVNHWLLGLANCVLGFLIFAGLFQRLRVDCGPSRGQGLLDGGEFLWGLLLLLGFLDVDSLGL